MEVVHLRCGCGDQCGDSVVVLAAAKEADVVVAAEGIWAREPPKGRTFSVGPVDEIVPFVERRRRNLLVPQSRWVWRRFQGKKDSRG